VARSQVANALADQSEEFAETGTVINGSIHSKICSLNLMDMLSKGSISEFEASAKEEKKRRKGLPTYDLEQFYDHMVDAIKTIYFEGARKGEVKEVDVDDVAILFLSLFDFCLHINFTRSDSRDPEMSVRLFRIAFQGLAETMTPGHRPETLTGSYETAKKTSTLPPPKGGCHQEADLKHEDKTVDGRYALWKLKSPKRSRYKICACPHPLAG